MAEAGTVEERVGQLLKGAIDPHVHSGPSIAERGIDHLELVQQASDAGFAAVVTKDHDYSGVIATALISKHHPELRTKLYSSIVLNNVVLAPEEDLRKQIDAAGVDQTMLCSDLSQKGTFSPLEGFRRSIRLCMDLGYPDEDIRKVVSLNAARAIGIEADEPTVQ